MGAAQIQLDRPQSLLFSARTKIREKVESMLDLGETPENVAASLAHKNVWGVPHARRCYNPIVRLFRQELADTLEAQVTTDGMLRIVLRNGWHLCVPLPQPVTDFLDGFDRGEFPELEVWGIKRSG